MKKLIWLLVVFTALLVYTAATATELDINETNFPDQVFREYLLNSIDGASSIEGSSKDGKLNDKEIKGVGYLGFSSKDLKSLEGIHFFTNLDQLDCSGTSITELDLSNLTKLTRLNCIGNSALQTLTLSSSVESVDCQQNQLKTLNLTGCTKLYSLLCNNNQLESLDVSNCTALYNLDCFENKLTSLKLSPSVEMVNCLDNLLPSLNVDDLNKLRFLFCQGNKYTSLDVTKCKELCWLVQNERRAKEDDDFHYWFCYVDGVNDLELYVDSGLKVIAGSFVSERTGWPDTQFIDSVTVTVNYPPVGSSSLIDPTLTVPQNANYYVEFTTWIPPVGGSGEMIFEAGKTYYMGFFLEGNKKYGFTDNVKVNVINGELNGEPEVIEDSGYYVLKGAITVHMPAATPEGTDPGAQGTDPGAQGTDPGAQGTDPGAQGTDPGSQGTEPAPQGETVQDKACTYQIVGSKAIVTAPKNRNAKSVTIPDTIKVNGKKIKVTQIADGAFMNMAKLKTVKIGNNVTVIGEDAFSGCKKLDSVTFGNSVKTIKANAFRLCKKLKKLFFTGKKLKKVAAKAFSGAYSSPAVQCPKGKAKAYSKLLQKGGIKKGKYTEK